MAMKMPKTEPFFSQNRKQRATLEPNLEISYESYRKFYRNRFIFLEKNMNGLVKKSHFAKGLTNILDFSLARNITEQTDREK